MRFSNRLTLLIILGLFILNCAKKKKSGVNLASTYSVLYQVTVNDPGMTLTKQNAIIMRKRLEAFGLEGEVEVIEGEPAKIRVKIVDPTDQQLAELRGLLETTGAFTLRIVDESSDFLHMLGKSLPSYRASQKSEGGIHTIEWSKDGYLRAVRKAELVSFMETAKIPDDHIVAFEQYVDSDPKTRKTIATYWRAHYIFQKIELKGNDVSKAFIALTGEGDHVPKETPYISVELTEEGAKIFERVTTDHVKEKLAILFDDQVLMAPMIMEPISGGRLRMNLGQGSGRSDQIRLAREILSALQHGAYAAPVREVEVKKDGAKL